MNDMKMHFILKLMILATIIASSCSRKIEYEEYAEIQDNAWEINDIKSFDVPIQDTSNAFHVFLMLRNNGEYPWRNIHMFVTTTSPAGHQVKDTVEYYLADEMGKWLGSGWGHIWTNQLPFRLNVRFPHKGIYKFDIQHGMRNEVLPGILDVGVMIKKLKTKES
jgi:gliding motility-associated lipoprotein GldH